MTRLGALVLLLPACASAPDAVRSKGVVDLTVDLTPPDEGYQVVTEPAEVAPYTEFRACSVVRLEPHGDEELTWVSEFQSLSSVGSHHLNALLGTFSFLDVALGEGAGEDALGVGVGTYDCDDLDLMQQVRTFFPSQRSDQRITLPPGVAAPFTTPLLVIFDHHYVNTTADTLLINGGLNFMSVDPEEVAQVAGLTFDDISDLQIEPDSRQVIASTCVVDRAVDVALVSTHTHAQAECATMNAYDGATGEVSPEPFFVNRVWETPPILHMETGTFHLEPGDGIHWACHYANAGDTTLINDGTAAGEMCVMAAATYPAPYTRAEIESMLVSRELSRLNEVLGAVMAPCDSRVEAASPYETTPVPLAASEEACGDLQQTASNVLYE